MNKATIKILLISAVCTAIAGILAVWAVKQLHFAVPAHFSSKKPTMLEFGAQWCKPCASMKDVIKTLKRDCGARLRIILVDVDTQPDLAARYQIKVLPTQIFISADGRELFRNEGFLPAAAIKSRWRALGCNIE